LATATSADRETVATLTRSIATLTDQLKAKDTWAKSQEAEVRRLLGGQVISSRTKSSSSLAGHHCRVWRAHRQHHYHGGDRKRRPLAPNQSQRTPNQHVRMLASDWPMRFRMPPDDRSCSALHRGGRRARHVVSCSLRVKFWQGGNSTGADCITPANPLEAPERRRGNSTTSDPCSASQVIFTCHS
jgi:hypothetical protein